MATTVERPTGKEQSRSNNELDNWIRIIEYIAQFKTELWMLRDVFRMGPKKLPENLGQHSNEMVAFRCLASLFDSKDEVAAAESKIEFDSSKSCEDVLQCILDEIPLSELKPGAPGLSKWNLVPFTKSKLLCFPKCDLEMMMDTSNEKDAQVSPCNGEESMRVDGTETDQVTSPMADPEPSVHGPVDEANENSRSHHSSGDGAEISRSHASLQNNASDGYVSSPSENNIYRCIQCKQSGKLLFCSRDGCTVMVHEKCVGDSPPVYDVAGNFYCSLCAFGCVSAEYLQSQEEVAKAKKKLLSFLSLMSNVNKKKLIQG